jgi:hypothetical protein
VPKIRIANHSSIESVVNQTHVAVQLISCLNMCARDQFLFTVLILSSSQSIYRYQSREWTYDSDSCCSLFEVIVLWTIERLNCLVTCSGIFWYLLEYVSSLTLFNIYWSPFYCVCEHMWLLYMMSCQAWYALEMHVWTLCISHTELVEVIEVQSGNSVSHERNMSVPIRSKSLS